MPVLPVTAIAPGWHEATIEGFTYRSSTSNANPMVEVDITLDTGELTSFYLLVTQGQEAFQKFMYAVGRLDIAESIRAKLNPSFELDDTIGERIQVLIPANSGFITQYMRIPKDPRIPNAKRS